MPVLPLLCFETPQTPHPLPHPCPRLLEDLVKRLTTELAKAQSASITTSSISDRLDNSSTAAAEAFLATLPEGAPLPSWLKDPAHLNPLLAAYDARIASLNGQLASRAEAFGALEGQVKRLVAENEQLAKRCERQADALEAKLAANEGMAGPGVDQAQLQVSACVFLCVGCV